VKRRVPADSDVKSIVARQVVRLRKEAGLSQTTVADRCKIFRTYLSRIEHATANPSIGVMAALATALNVKIGELFEE
jgi:transcriptional regulator with XRE-family HTH domain